jgi:hypothetical protein
MKSELTCGPEMKDWREKTYGHFIPESPLTFEASEIDLREQQKALDRHRIHMRKSSNKVKNGTSR